MFSRLTVLGAAVAICGWCSTAGAGEKVVFAAGGGSLSYVTYYAADEMGFFDQAGVEPEMILTGSGSKAMAAAVGGDVDVVMRSPSEILKARRKGIDLQLFGAVSTQLSTNVVFSRRWADAHNITADSKTEDKVAALKGVRLAITSPGSLTDAVARYFARRGGLNPDRDMTLVSIQNQANAMMIAMDQGRIDGFVVGPPDTNIAAAEQGAVIAFDLAAVKVPELSNFFQIGIAGTPDFIKSAKAEKVAKAFQMTLDAIRNPAETEAVRDRVRSRYYPNVKPEVFAKVWQNVVLGTPATLVMNDELFKGVAVLENVLDPQGEALPIAGSYTNAVASKLVKQ